MTDRSNDYDLHCIVDSENLDEFDSLLLPLKHEMVLVQGRKHAATAVRGEGDLVLLSHDDVSAVVDAGEGALREEDDLRLIQAVVVVSGKECN